VYVLCYLLLRSDHINEYLSLFSDLDKTQIILL
jgi:hypothetical protein